jgi:serine protease AprX
MRILLVIFLIASCLFTWTAHAAFPGPSTNPPLYYWVSFTDKDGTPYSLVRPQEFLSARSVERRLRQAIPLDEADLPVNPVYVDSLLGDTAVAVYYVSRWMNGALVRAPLEHSIERIRQLPFVSGILEVKPDLEAGPGGSKDVPGSNGIQSMDPFSEPNYGESRQQVEQLNGQILHALGFVGQGMHIAVLDAGFLNVDELWMFERMRTEGRLLGVRDFVDRQGDPLRGHTHGMAVLSVMAADSPGQLVGTAPGASYWLLRTEDAGSEYIIEEYNWLAAAEFADSAGVDIINSSLGYTRFDDPAQDHTYEALDGQTTVVSRAANMAFERGMLVVNSAGNYGTQNWSYIGAPADAFGALAVGAVNAEGNRTSWSSVGPAADGRTKPDVMAMGYRVAAVNPFNGIAYVNGTSFSSPLVAGMAACLWQNYPILGAADIKTAIIRSASRFGYPDSLMGNGIPDFRIAREMLEAAHDGQQSAMILPNPLQPHSIIDFFSSTDDRMDVQLVNMKGAIVYQVTGMQVHTGFNGLRPFNGISHLPAGVYLVRLTSDNFNKTLKALIID